MKNTLTLLFLAFSLCWSNTLTAQFEDCYDVSNWTVSHNNSNDGYVNTSNAPADITIVSGDNGVGSGYVFFTVDVITDGDITFDWSYYTNDWSPIWDPSGYILNGTQTQLSGSLYSGSETIPVAEGDVFSFYAYTSDGIFGRSFTTISNFSGPCCELEVSIAEPAGPIYYGYEPFACTTLEASSTGAAGAVTYSWSMDGDPDDGQEFSTVCASGPECIVVTVTAEDENGCLAEAAMLVQVIDVVCHDENGVQKVELCHKHDGNNPNTLCVAPDAVAAHLAHGDILGACGEEADCSPVAALYSDVQDNILIQSAKAQNRSTAIAPIPRNAYETDGLARQNINVFPNPSADFVNIQMLNGLSGSAKITVYNHRGQIVMNTNADFAGSKTHKLQTNSLDPGSYKVKIAFEKGQEFTQDLMVIK
jgi:hypothetical protein